MKEQCEWAAEGKQSPKFASASLPHCRCDFPLPQKTILAHEAINTTVTDISPACVYATCHGTILRQFMKTCCLYFRLTSLWMLLSPYWKNLLQRSHACSVCVCSLDYITFLITCRWDFLLLNQALSLCFVSFYLHSCSPAAGFRQSCVLSAALNLCLYIFLVQPKRPKYWQML